MTFWSWGKCSATVLRHSTEVAFALFTQQARVRFSAFPRICDRWCHLVARVRLGYEILTYLNSLIRWNLFENAPSKKSSGARSPTSGIWRSSRSSSCSQSRTGSCCLRATLPPSLETWSPLFRFVLGLGFAQTSLGHVSESHVGQVAYLVVSFSAFTASCCRGLFWVLTVFFTVLNRYLLLQVWSLSSKLPVRGLVPAKI